jgi:hypothetical protein
MHPPDAFDGSFYHMKMWPDMPGLSADTGRQMMSFDADGTVQ